MQLTRLNDLAIMGVPIRKLQRENDIDMSEPTFKQLIEHYNTMLLAILRKEEMGDVMHGSLFPQWLEHAADGAQEQPEAWKYAGRFPIGVWVRR